jgi:SAM-dependent methyltransferase
VTERAVPGDPLWAELAAPHLARYLFAIEFCHGHRVLDAASGSGYGARLLRSGGAAAVVGVDVDAAAVAQAQSQFGGDGVEFLGDDCETLQRLSGRFELICSFETIEHLQRPERFLAAAARLLAPDGTLLCSTPDRSASPPTVDGRPRNRFHVHEWYREEFRQLLAAHFAEIEIRVQIRSTALESREAAVAALRQGLSWCNPLAAFLWRKLPQRGGRPRPWKQLAGLATGSPTDYPIVPLEIAPLLGKSCFHVAICRKAKGRGGSS